MERAMGVEDATWKGQGQWFFCAKFQRRPGQSMKEGLNVCEKVANSFEKISLSLERRERLCECDHVATFSSCSLTLSFPKSETASDRKETV